MMRILKLAGLLIVLAALTAAPVVAALVILGHAKAQVDPPAAATWAPVTPADAQVTEPAGVLVSWEEPHTAPAPLWPDAVVQEVLLQPGAEVKTGSKIAVFERVTRIAAHTAFPFDRSLAFNDRGPDVTELNGLLETLGYRFTKGDHFTRVTEAGVRELAKDLGAGDAREFEPEWVVFLPVKRGVVGEVHLKIGQPVVSTGEPVFTYVAEPAAAIAYGQNEFENLQVTLADAADAAPAQVNELPESSLASGLVLSLLGEEFITPDDPGGFSKEDLARIAAVIKPAQTEVPALLIQDLPDDSVQIPAAAVYTAGSNASCVMLRSDAQAVDRSQAVEVIDSNYGVAIVSGISLNAEVWVNPPVAERRPCG